MQVSPDAGYENIVVSHAPAEVVERVSEKIGFDRSFSVSMSVKEGFYTGFLQNGFHRQDGKKSIVQEIKDYASVVKDRIYENHPDTEYLIPIRRVCNICGDIAEIRINDILSQKQIKIEKKKK